MKNLFNQFVFGTVLLSSLMVAGPVYGQYYSNGGNTPELVIDKKIRPIDSKTYFDNISSDQKIFTEGDQIEFKIVVENRGNITLTNIKVQDMLPKYLSLLVFPGSYDKDQNVINTEILSLEPGQSKEYLVLARIKDLPTGSNTKLQMVNVATAKTTNAADRDEAKYFVAMKSVPSTGASDILIKTGLVITMAAFGLGMRKIARGY